MGSINRQYLFGLLFIIFGGYQIFKNHDYLESSLYMVAGLSFAFNAATSEPRLIAYKKVLVLITWGLIISAGILFLYLLQFKI
jgi:hypothetical protein